MAQTITSVCDWCDLHGITDVPATTGHLLALDGPPRRVDVCPRCDTLLDDLAELYERGQDLPPAGPPASSRPAVRTRSVPTDQAVGTARTGTTRRAIAGPRTSPEDGDTTTSTGEPSPARVLCPLPHPGAGGGPTRVSYAGRSSHADVVHDAKVWEIRWEDPDDILRHPCIAHRECATGDLRFISAKGLKNHIAGCPLPRVDSATPV
jgi:hypothetical protein